MSPNKKNRVHRDNDLDDNNRAATHWRENKLNKLTEDLKPHEVEVPPLWRSCSEPGRLYLGECFPRSYAFISKLCRTRKPGDPTKNDLWLVHGEYMGWHRHAWVELPGEVVFDGNLQQFYARAGYYDAVDARPWYKYSPWGALLVSANMPLNPDGTVPLANWHSHLKLPWANPDNPTEIDDDRARELILAAGLHAGRGLARLGAKKPGVWMSASEWAKYVARLRWTSNFVPEADRRTAAGRTRAVEQVLDANLQETLVGDTRTGYVTMLLEKRSRTDSAPYYRFRVLGRKNRSATTRR